MKQLKLGSRDIDISTILQFVGPGWGDLLTTLIKDLFELGWDGKLLQVKEKFGGLRFYIGRANNLIHDRIALAENESYHICEQCGQPGKARTDIGWIRTLCEHCYQQFKQPKEVPTTTP